MNIGGLYCYPEETKDIWDNIKINGFVTGQQVKAGEPFIVLKEVNYSENKNRPHLKILTASGIIGWIAYVDKDVLREVTQK